MLDVIKLVDSLHTLYIVQDFIVFAQDKQYFSKFYFHVNYKAANI